MKGKKRKRIIVLCILITVLFAVILWIAWGNTALELNTYTIKSDKLPESFSGYRIAHVSDLHNTQIGDKNAKLLKMIEESEPDMIAITGDLIDSRNTNVAVALQFAEKAIQIAPCYYVTGNHEARIPEYEELKNGLVKLGVVVLENASVEIEHNDEKILLMGVDDPSFQTDYLLGDAESIMKTKLQTLTSENDAYMVLLSHRPELFDTYVESGVDLVLSGHAHGGQFRLPFVGGLVAPNQGLFPKYDAGMYANADTIMIVSRGIGNSIIPFRFNNRPEVLLIELVYTP